MNADDPRHGSPAGAHAHRRDGEKPCQPCLFADAIAGRRRRKRRALGAVFRVELGERTHARLLELRANGATYQQIADWSGLSFRTVHAAVNNGPNAVVATATYNALVTMRPVERIGSLGLTRRVQALQRLGYSIRRLSGEIGVSPQWLYMIRDGRVGDVISARCRDQIVEAYDRLHMSIPSTSTTGDRKSVTRARSDAERRRFTPPLAWQNIDDPNERPHGNRFTHRAKTDIDPVAVDRAIAGGRVRLTRAERFEVVGRMQAAGWSLQRIEEQTGITRADRYVARGDVA